jgi:hypothetical protein
MLKEMFAPTLNSKLADYLILEKKLLHKVANQTRRSFKKAKPALRKIDNWIWDRHLNPLSWYIRPVLMIPIALAAYFRQSYLLIVSFIAFMTSMFWFNKPQQVNPLAKKALDYERNYLKSNWDLKKVLLSLLVPLGMLAFVQAFWQRSLKIGLIVFNVLVAVKIIWTYIIFDRKTANYHLKPALAGLGLVNLLIVCLKLFDKNES